MHVGADFSSSSPTLVNVMALLFTKDVSGSRSQFFALNLMEGSCKLNEADVQAQLEWIYEQTLSTEQKQPDVGLLTTEGRTDWAQARDQLIKGPHNTHTDMVLIARETDR